MRFILVGMIILFMNSILLASYEEALELYKTKKYSDSLKLIANELFVAKDMEPNSPNYKLRYLAAHNHWKIGSYNSAIFHFKRCAEIMKTSIDPLLDISLLLVEIKRYAEAERIATRALKLQKNAFLYLILGKCSFGYSQYFRAKKMFETSISIDPELYIAYNNLGITLMKLKKYSEANTAFSAALAIAPNNSRVINNIGLSLEKEGDYKKAYTTLKRASTINPKNSAIIKNLNRLKRKLEKNKIKNYDVSE